MTHVAYKSDVLRPIDEEKQDFIIANFERTNYYYPKNWGKTSNNGNIKIPITGVYQLMLSANDLTSISLVALALEVYLNNKFILSNTTSLTPIVLVVRLTTNNFLFNKNDDVSIKVKASPNGEYYI